MNERFDAWYQEYVRRPNAPLLARRALKLLNLLVNELERDQVHVRAATLAYWSLVAIVPVLVLVMAIASAVGGEGATPITDILYRSLLAGAVERVGTTLDGWLAGVDLRKIGIVGVIVVGFTASRIYFSVEQAFNTLWNVRIRRSFVTRLVLFYAFITFVPLFVSLGFHVTGRVAQMVDVSWLGLGAPTLLTAVGFVGAIKVLPDTEVQWGPALIGGLTSAVLFEMAKVGFNAYTAVLGAADSAALIYGSLGLFPVFLVWLYLLWIIVLVGVKLAYVTQRREDLMEAEDRRILAKDQGRHQADALFAVQCLMVVIRNFQGGNGPTSEPAVTHALRSEPIHIVSALETLEQAGVLAATADGWLPAIPPDRISVRDVIVRYRAITRPAMAEGAVGSRIIEDLLASPGAGLDATLSTLVAAG